MFLPMFSIILFIMLIVAMLGGSDTAIIRAIEIPGEYLIIAKAKADENSSDFIRLLVESTNIAGGEKEQYNAETLEIAYTKILDTLDNQEIYDIYKKIYSEIKTGPIPKSSIVNEWVYEMNLDTGKKEWVEINTLRNWTYSHYEDFGAKRTYGGDRSHLGNDVIADKGTPLLSITDGVITRLGWDELGGWRVGIIDTNGTYWYYAHMLEYAPDIQENQYITAGTLIGYVGNSGYGPIGTTGQFIDHLHLQIGIAIEPNSSSDDEYIWINPYPIMVYTEHMRVQLN